MSVEDTSDRGAGIETELVAADERRRRIGEPRRLDDADELLRADERERIERPRLRARAGSGGSREATDPPVGAHGAARLRSASARSRSAGCARCLAEDDDEPEVRVVERVEPVVERAAERREQADVVRAGG